MGLHLRSHTPESLAAAIGDGRLPVALARRVVSRLVWEDRDDLGGVRGLSTAMQRELLSRGDLARLEVVDRRRSRVDPFVKYLFRAPDGSTLEAVRIPLHRPRWSVCVSSQSGCPLGCAFCETGRLGPGRNLKAWEIVEQVLTVRREAPERPVTGVVFQGQGEPLLNYDAVIAAARLMQHPTGLRIRGGSITISTVGLLPQMERFLEERHPYRLILSLHSAFQERRAALLPVAGRFDVGDLAAAARRIAATRRDPVQLAWVLMSGVNTGEDEAEELGRRFAGVPVRLSIIDVNDPSGRFRRAGDAERGRFLAALKRHGIGFVRRYSGGPDIGAACGMLASAARGGDALGASDRFDPSIPSTTRRPVR